LNGSGTPFATDEFDRVAIVDYLEHIPGDAELMAELQRVLKPGGLVVINVPYLKNSLLRRLRIALGQTDEKHGHLRPGYTVELLDKVMGQAFTRQSARTYSKFFSELIDTLIVFGVSRLQKGKQEQSKKGLFVTGQDLKANQKMFRAYSLIYPIVWFFAKLDSLLVFSSGYMLIVTARVNKDPQRLSSF
jgi:SAM-dependent methyltransferase